MVDTAGGGIATLFDARPVRTTSSDAPWEKAIAARNEIADAVRNTLGREGVKALVYTSQSGNYPPWVRLEAWLPRSGAGSWPDDPARERVELEIVIDVRPYYKVPLVETVRFTHGKRKIAVVERPLLGPGDARDWTLHALGRGPRPTSYRPITDKLLSIAGAFIRPLNPRHNPVAKSFRSSFWRGGTLVMAGFALLFLLQPVVAAARAPSAAAILALSTLALLIAAIIVAGQSFRRSKVIAVTAQPVTAPRNLGLVDSWHTVIAGLGSDYDAVRKRILARVAEARAFGVDAHVEVQSHRTPNGYEERERLVVAKDQGQVHVHIHPFGRDVFVGWHAFLNWAGWAESKPVSSKVGAGRQTDFVELRPGFYVPQQFDLMDLNSLSELVHRNIEREIKAILREKAIDQQIDFEIIRGDRDRALDRSRHLAEAPTASGGGLWSRIFRSAAVWQPAAMAEVQRSVVEPRDDVRPARMPASGSALVLPLAALVLCVALYAAGLWGGGVQIALGVRYYAVPLAAVAALLAFALWRYAAAGATTALAAAVALFAISSGLSLAQGLINANVINPLPSSQRMAAYQVAGLAGGVLGAVALMGVAAWAAPVLRRRSYWIVAILVWPLITLAGFAIVQSMAREITPAQLPVAYFAVAVLKQVVVFWCLGYWLRNAADQRG